MWWVPLVGVCGVALFVVGAGISAALGQIPATAEERGWKKVTAITTSDPSGGDRQEEPGANVTATVDGRPVKGRVHVSSVTMEGTHVEVWHRDGVLVRDIDQPT